MDPALPYAARAGTGAPHVDLCGNPGAQQDHVRRDRPSRRFRVNVGDAMRFGQPDSAGSNTAAGVIPERRVAARGGALHRFAAVVLAGVICGFLSAIMSIGAASLVVAVHLSDFVSFLVGIALLSAGVLSLTFSLLGSMKGTIATVQAIPCVAVGGVVGATAAGMSPTDGNVFLTAMLAAALSTVVSGVGMVLLGVFRLGEIVRFIPFPVVGGFLAGTGWLILLGGLGIVLAEPASIGIFTTVPEPAALLRLGLAALFVAALVLAMRRYASPLVLPVVVLIAVAVFNVARLLTGETEAYIHAADWVIDLPQGREIWHGFNSRLLDEIYWPAVGVGLLQSPTLLILAAIGLLLNTTAIEHKRNEDVDLSRDLRSEGIGNALSGLLGGLPGFKAVAPTLIADHLGADGRWVGVIAGAMLLGVLMFGTHLLDIFPTFVFGGILLWLGGSLIVEWLVVQTRQVGRWDTAIIFLIFVTIVAYGFGVGLISGVIAAVLLFIYQYSRVDIVRNEMTGAAFRSSIAARPGLAGGSGEEILIVQLGGFLFFGTANRFRLRIQDRMKQLGASGHGFLVVDFRQVTGVDSSASNSFVRLRRAAADSGVIIVLTGLGAAARSALLGARDQDALDATVHVEPDLESGLRWCEDALLAAAGRTEAEGMPLSATLGDLLEDRGAVETIGRYCERSIVAPGTTLLAQDTTTADIFFIESGNASVDIAGHDGAPIHVVRLGAGDIVGEIGFYVRDKRSASVVARDEMVVWRLSSEAIERLQDEDPAAALNFHRGMAAMLSRRVARTSRHLSILAG